MDKNLFDIRVLATGEILLIPQDRSAHEITKSQPFKDATEAGMYLGFDCFKLKNGVETQYSVKVS